ncbi:MAG TPA: glycosyltransferase family A protein [Candidatus Binatia bacterium]|nr:glycosyltransferase family A protein [Candidatus Binatia bacterium]
MKPWFRRPTLSVVVIIYNMHREAPRTLYSLSAQYQQGISAGDYEVIVVDNGSVPPFPAEQVREQAGRFAYFYIDQARPSPAGAVNFGVRQSRGAYVGIMIDGARIASPGLLHYALRAFRAFRNPVVTTLAWHLGPAIHRQAVKRFGYSRHMEDQLLERIRWPEDGYRLFEIATLAGSSRGGWFAPKSESSSLFLHRKSFDRLGGYDERFDQPGGGLVNIDTYIRACELPNSELVMLLGEGTFHQMHGGAMTGATQEESRQKLALWTAQYTALRNAPLRIPLKEPHYIGHVPPAVLPSVLTSAQDALTRRQGRGDAR